MPAKIDLTGKTFNKLTVISCAGTVKRKLMWNCVCECGKELSVIGVNLTHGYSRSCGCLKYSHQLKSDITYVLRYYKRGAEQRGYSYNLSRELAESLLNSNCYYCGAAPDNRRRGLTYMGIDRVDNSRGYEPDNVVPCCITCNRAKMAMPIIDFKKWVYNVFDHMNAKDIKSCR